MLGVAGTVGGVERVMLGLARGLQEGGVPTRAVFAAGPGGYRLRAWAAEQRAPIELDARLNPERRTLVTGVFALARLIRRADPQVVNLHYGTNDVVLRDVLAVRLSGRRRVVVSVHHPDVSGRRTWRRRLATRLAVRLADGVIANSAATAAGLRARGVPDDRVRLVPCGVLHAAPAPTREQARAALGIADDAFVVACLTRLVEYKGVHELIRATARLARPAGAKVVLLVGGDGPERVALERQGAAELGSACRVLGPLTERERLRLLAAADVFALPSHEEGFGLVYVEAALLGVPSVGCAAGGVPEVIEDGRTGLLVPPGDERALACALERLRDAPALRAQLGAAARERALAEFGAALMVQRYRRLLQV